MSEVKFPVGDVVRLRAPHIAWAGDAYEPARPVHPEKIAPAGVEGVVKLCYLYPRGYGNAGYPSEWRIVAIPEMRCFVHAPVDNLEPIAHQPSPGGITAMYADAR